jgi:ABC-type spermidine/putrescine transport system permease subunit I
VSAAVAETANAAALRTDAAREQAGYLALAAPGLLIVAILLALPVGWMAWLSLYAQNGAFGLSNYRDLALETVNLSSILTTFRISAVVTLICLALGYPFAYALAEMPRRWSALLMIAVILPYWTSILVRTYAWLVLLQRRGLVNQALEGIGLVDEPLRLVHNEIGTIIGMTHIMLPFLILPLYAAMRSIDRSYIRAAASLGASPIGAFWKVFVPLSLPGVASGTFLVFVICLGFYITPAILGGGRVVMVAQQIEKSLTLYAHFGAASALGIVLLVLSMTTVWLAIRMARRGPAASLPGAGA